MMSAWQRCMSAIYLRGQLEDTVILKTVHALPNFEYNYFYAITLKKTMM